MGIDFSNERIKDKASKEVESKVKREKDLTEPCAQYFEENHYKIGMFSKMTQVPIKTLRYYDEIGLLSPQEIDKDTGYRLYSTSQLPEVYRIIFLRRLGFSLDEISQALKGASERSLLEERKIDILRQIAQATQRLSEVEHYLLLEKEGFNPKVHVVLKSLPEVIVASCRKTLSTHADIFKMAPMMGEEMERLGCVCASPAYCFNRYHDMEYKETNIDIEICEAVTELKPDSEIIKFKVLSEVPEAACAMHKGPYSRISETYVAIINWIESNGYEIADIPRESVIDGIWNKTDPNDWLTEIQFPVKKKA